MLTDPNDLPALLEEIAGERDNVVRRTREMFTPHSSFDFSAADRMAEQATALRKHAALLRASSARTGDAPAPSDRMLGLRFVTDPTVPTGEVQLRDKGRVVARLINVEDGEIVTGSRVEAPVPSGTSREIIERAHRFAWAYGSHRSPCPLAADINAPDSIVCTCGYDRDADALMDDEDALGMDFWKVARANSAAPASARADAPAPIGENELEMIDRRAADTLNGYGFTDEAVYDACRTIRKLVEAIRSAPARGDAPADDATQFEAIRPGVWDCPKCGFTQVTTILNPTTGATGAQTVHDADSLVCPNDGSPLRAATWKAHALELRRMIDDLDTQLTAARADREDAERMDWLERRNAVKQDVPVPILPSTCGFSVRGYIDERLAAERIPVCAARRSQGAIGGEHG